jgi:hypothetical protein
MMRAAKDVEIEVEIRAETPKALLVYNGKTEVWVAKSQIRDQCENDLGTITSIFLTEWMASEKGLI